MSFKHRKFQIVQAMPVSLSHLESGKVIVEEGIIEEKVYKLHGRQLDAADYHKVARVIFKDALIGYLDTKEAGSIVTRDQVLEDVSRGNLYAESWSDGRWQPVAGSAVRISDLMEESKTGEPVVAWPEVLGRPVR